MAVKDFEQLSHTADLKIRVYGSTLEELFEHALIGMFQIIGPHAKECTQHNGRLVCPMLPQEHTIELVALDRESLLVDFLSEALYLSDVHNEVYLAADVHVTQDTSLKATVRGVVIESCDVVEIKAVTYHDLAIKNIDGVWQTDIVFDI